MAKQKQTKQADQLDAPIHIHEFHKGKSGSVEVCRCGKFQFTAEYLKSQPTITEQTD